MTPKLAAFLSKVADSLELGEGAAHDFHLGLCFLNGDEARELAGIFRTAASNYHDEPNREGKP